MNAKTPKENFHMFYSWFLSHVVDRFADGLPVAQYYARTFGYSVKSIVFTLTIPRLNTEPIVKKALNGLRIHVIETEEQLVDKDSLEKWHKPVRDRFLSVINNQDNNTGDPILDSTQRSFLTSSILSDCKSNSPKLKRRNSKA